MLMLGTAGFLGWDIEFIWQDAAGRDWVRYAARDRQQACKGAFLLQCIHSEKYRGFHFEPLVELPIGR